MTRGEVAGTLLNRGMNRRRCDSLSAKLAFRRLLEHINRSAPAHTALCRAADYHLLARVLTLRFRRADMIFDERDLLNRPLDS